MLALRIFVGHKAAVDLKAHPGQCVGGAMWQAALMVPLALFLFLQIFFSSGLNADEVRLDTDQIKALATANTSVIEGNAVANTTGIVRVNITAGDGNVQQNSAAFSQSSGPSGAIVKARQSANDLPTDFYQQLSARIEAGAFNGALGIVMVNQSSGVGNAQFNGAAVAIGGVGSGAVIQLDNSTLEGYSASTGVVADDLNASGAALVEASTSLSPDAFQNAKGIIMINQTAGNNNAAANSFTLSVTQ